ncbi:type II toxin-antitoxin system HigB family toxin [Sinorhizobium arboris]|uniref:type II toxin-antitoxin system HigB family toxin n=1 Tax=Sinorhizobium arboris TaxID=76745 RepID=UPI001F1F06E5|nr:type II toxin-antitoxin system HigB family toxin [Sinorhizobium arboris]
MREFVDSLAGQKDQPAVKAALDAWFDEVSTSEWASSADMKRRYATTSIVNSGRTVFNIKGNDYPTVWWWLSISRRASSPDQVDRHPQGL